MKQLVIIGARGYGREIYDRAKSCEGFAQSFDIKGFLDDKTSALDGYDNNPPIIGEPKTYVWKDDDVFVVALGDPFAKRQYVELALSRGGVPYSLISKNAEIGQNSKLGQGCMILGGARVSVDCEIGDFVTLNHGCDIGHDAKIGSFCHVGAFCFMGGFSELGNAVTLHPRSSILPHKKVGDSAIVGAGSVCIRNVKSSTTVFGVPAKQF